MTRRRSFWLVTCVWRCWLRWAPSICRPMRRSPAVPQPLITEALVDVETAALTINGYDFPTTVPQVTLGMTELDGGRRRPSRPCWLGCPSCCPAHTCWRPHGRRGSSAVFFLTVGAAGPAGTARTPGAAGRRWRVPVDRARVFLRHAGGGRTAAAADEDEGGGYTPQDHSGSCHQHTPRGACAGRGDGGQG